jgi:hypothetical protein
VKILLSSVLLMGRWACPLSLPIPFKLDPCRVAGSTVLPCASGVCTNIFRIKCLVCLYRGWSKIKSWNKGIKVILQMRFLEENIKRLKREFKTMSHLHLREDQRKRRSIWCRSSWSYKKETGTLRGLLRCKVST